MSKENNRNKIIDFSPVQLQSKEIKPSSFIILSAHNLINRVVQEYSYKNDAEKARISTKLENDFYFKGDEVFASYILVNLIKNAFCYLEYHPNLNIVIGTRIGKNCNSLYVYNYDYPLLQETINLATKDFIIFEGDQSEIDLSFCAKIMNSFGGKMKCRLEEDKYAEFVLLFPFAKEKLMSQSNPNLEILVDQTKSILSNKGADDEEVIKILIAEDQEASLVMIKSLLEKYLHVSCDIAKNGEEAIEKVTNTKYTIVIIDAKLPIISGIEAAREIRKFNKDVVMIAYSNAIVDMDKNEIKAAGFNEYLAWPIQDNMLFRTIAKWLLIKRYWFAEQPSEPRIAAALQDKTLLLVDDQDLNRVLVTSYLIKNYDIIIDQASNGREAVDKFIAKAKEGQPYDLVFMDVKMPVMDGIAATKEIRIYQEGNKMKNIPIVAITGDSDKESIYKIFNAGMDDYFIKGDSYDNITKILMLWTNIVGETNIYNEKISGVKQSLKSNVINKSYGELLPQIIPLFIKEGQALIDDMKKAKESNNFNQLAFSFNAFKGMCGNMKAERLYKLCSYVSDLAKQGKFPADDDWMGEVERAFIDTKNELVKYL